MPNTWTLCYEEQFYAVVGLGCAARHFFSATLGLCAVTLCCRHAARAYGANLSGCFLDGHWLLFAAGIAVFFQLRYATRRQWWQVTALLCGGMIYAVADRALTTQFAERHLDEYIFVSCSFALLLNGLRRWDAALMSQQIFAPFQWLGQRSYSIYLTHFPLTVVLSCCFTQLGYGSPLAWLLLTLPVTLGVSLAHRLVVSSRGRAALFEFAQRQLNTFAALTQPDSPAYNPQNMPTKCSGVEQVD